MHKKFLKIAVISASILLYKANSVYAGFWNAWANEDEEVNTKSSSGKASPSNKYSSQRNVSSTRTSSTVINNTYNNTSYNINSATSKNNVSANAVSYEYLGDGSGTMAGQNIFNVDAVNNQKPIVICRQKGCTELNDKMTRNYLFNAIANLLYVNNKTKVYLCEANTSTRACISNGLKYAVNIGGTAGVIYIPSLTITDVSFSQNLKSISFMFSYDLYANGLKSFCTSSYNTIEISENKQALIRDNNYKCQLTSDLPSTSYNIYNIDYVDLDYGIIGAYYSTGISGASQGGHDGYVLMKFQYTDKNTVKPASKCKTGVCDDASYRIAPGQYEVIPLEK